MPSFAGARRRYCPKPLVILLIVEVEQDSFILYFKVYGALLVAAEDGAAACIPFERHDLGKDRTIEQDGVSAAALVGRDHYLRLGLAVLTAQLIEGFGANEGLVRQDDEGGVYLRIERTKPGSQASWPFPARIAGLTTTLRPWSNEAGSRWRMVSAEAPRTRTISFTAERRTFSMVRPSTVLSPRRSSCFASPMRVDLPAARMMAPSRESVGCRQ